MSKKCRSRYIAVVPPGSAMSGGVHTALRAHLSGAGTQMRLEFFGPHRVQVAHSSLGVHARFADRACFPNPLTTRVIPPRPRPSCAGNPCPPLLPWEWEKALVFGAGYAGQQPAASAADGLSFCQTGSGTLAPKEEWDRPAIVVQTFSVPSTGNCCCATSTSLQRIGF
jgi:hypothetical protein